MRTNLIILSVLGAIASTGIVTAEPDKKNPIPQIQLGDSATPAELTTTYCLACHGDGIAGQARLAPPFMMVKMHYQSLDKDTFIKTVSSWVKTPDAHRSKMPGAIRRFGVMPALPLPDAQLAAIAKHLYETDFEMPGHGGKGMGQGQGGGCCNSETAAASKSEAPACAACQKENASAPKIKAPACKACQSGKAPASKAKAPACASCQSGQAKASACEACQKADAAKVKVPACEACQSGKAPAPKAKAPACENCKPAKGDALAPAGATVPKWAIPAPMMAHLQSLEKDLTTFKTKASTDHADLARRIDKNLKQLISSCTMTGESHDNLHEWLMPFLQLAKQHAESDVPKKQTKYVRKMRRAFTTFHEQFQPAPSPKLEKAPAE